MVNRKKIKIMSKFGKNNKKSAENPEIYLSGRRKTTNS